MVLKEVTFAVIGYGGRGCTFAALAKKPQFFAQVVAVAEPDPDKRAMAARDCDIPESRVFASASDLLSCEKMSDAVINTTPDRMHIETAIPAMEKGYHLLLEKPMAVTLGDCTSIEETQRRTGVIVCVCHSLRYQTLYATIKQMIESDLIGDVVSLDQIEGVSPVHQSHSYVRGNWGNTSKSTFMLMAKSCHDIDILSYLVNRRCERVSSFGSLAYFSAKSKPAGAPSRCLDGCPAETQCLYHCGKVYLEDTFWRMHFPRKDDESVIEYLRTGPYGRCVFDCDNDVVDHQVVNLEYENGVTATFTMTAFHPGGRYVRVHGTRGYIEGSFEDGAIKHTNFSTGRVNTIQLPPGEGTHGGGDYLVMKSMVDAIRRGDPSAVLTSAQASLESHRIVFAAETSRLEKRVVELKEVCRDGI
ncbi:MAG: Gfo/Idh/MocA family protein [Armatimonadota bacterium]